MAQLVAHRDIISQLLKKSLAARNLSEQKLIAQQPRPLPKLMLKTKDVVFQEYCYTKKDWFCGSESMKRHFYGLVYRSYMVIDKHGKK